MTKIGKRRVCFYLADEVMEKARSISESVGIALSRLVQQGLERQIEKYEALRILTVDKDNELRH